MRDFVVILITTSSEEEAARIGRTLVEERLAACVNVIPDIRSFFHWEGKLQDEKEALLLVKSQGDQISRIIYRVKELHSYSVPEVIALPILAGSEDYLRWVRESIKGS